MKICVENLYEALNQEDSSDLLWKIMYTCIKNEKIARGIDTGRQTKDEVK